MPWNHQRYRRLLESSRLFGGLERASLDHLAVHSRTRDLGHGEYLWRQGAQARSFVIIGRGLIKIVRQMPDGSDSILGLFGPRESVGDVALLGKRIYPANALVASESAHILEVEAEPVLQPADQRADVWAAVNASLVEHTAALQAKIAIMSAGSVPKRLATLLVHLSTRFGEPRADDGSFVPLVISRSELGCLIGARIETTIRAMRQLEREGLVTTEDDGLRLHSLTELRTRMAMDNRASSGSNG